MRRLPSIVFALVFAGVGCSDRDGVRDAGDSARGLVRVELAYTHATGTPATEVRFDAQARFVRYRAFDPASVPTILGFTDFDSLPIDGCRVADGTAELDEALAGDSVLPAAEVALLDAGRLELRGPVDRAAMMPRHYPELVPFVSGVVYGGDETAPVSLALGQSYQIWSEGGSEVGPFSAMVTAPRALPALTVEPLRRGTDFDLRWATEPAAVTATVEPLLLEVKWTSRAGTRTVRCRARDDGNFSIPHESFEALPPASALTSFTATATRVSRGTLAAPGVGRGELTVALKDVATLQVGP
jgi:hypothetical protein